MKHTETLEKVEVRLSQEGIDWLKGHKRIYTNIAALIGKDADSVKRWVRTNHVRLIGADVIEAVKRLTGEDMSKFIVKG